VDEYNKNENEEDEKLIFGIKQLFFLELFLPKEKLFKNRVFDITIE
jgi:hypothetical protein